MLFARSRRGASRRSPTCALLRDLSFGHCEALRPAAFLGFTVKPKSMGRIAARSPRRSGDQQYQRARHGVHSRRGPCSRGSSAGLYQFALRRSATVFFQNRDDSQLFRARGDWSAPRQARAAARLGRRSRPFQAQGAPPAGKAADLPARCAPALATRACANMSRRPASSAPALPTRGSRSSARRRGTARQCPRRNCDDWVAEGWSNISARADDVRDALWPRRLRGVFHLLSRRRAAGPAGGRGNGACR